MAKVKLGLKFMTTPEKIQDGRKIVIDMTGNLTYPTPNPALPSITTIIDNMEGAYNDVQGAKLALADKTATLLNIEKEYDLNITLLANYVNNTSNGDANKIMSAGMRIASGPTPQPIPAQVVIQDVKDVSSGKLEIRWKKVLNARTYSVQINTDINDPAKWTLLQIVTKTKCLADSLTSGQKYWFRVQAIGTAGEGAWSDPYVKYAP